MQKFLSFSDAVVVTRKKIPAEYSAYLEKCWDESRKRQMRVWQELRDKQIVY